ncbi:MAG: universal stress protein [Pseudomonadales bacterium]|jgi:nucleotide-binding universal stress UspA family protein|nr:universal stress protein [Gammaproteobacteria bacterium]MBK8309080.1 universal stress protein [Gammaproteobacteria bacterium]MBP6050767.1 universal stress protein [Pseudomonadales bacterium]MBP6226824.1 universal stress protein [Pseudomonadales bacterium]
MNQTGNVLAAVGQFPQNDAVLARAAEIARAHRAKLTIVHVIDSLTGFGPAPADLALIQHQIRLIARENIEAAIARQEIDVPGIDIRIETGSPSLRLIEQTHETGADLVVMMAHEGESILAKVIGSTTDRVIRAACSPVLVVKRPVTQAYERVVVATDASDESGALVAFVAALFPLAGLRLVHVVRIPPPFEEAMRRAGHGQASVAAHRDALVRKAKACMHAISEQLAHRPTQSTTRVIASDPAKSLVRATRDPHVGLIALGPGSTSLIRRALLGSVTRRVLEAASCDVLICNPHGVRE